MGIALALGLGVLALVFVAAPEAAPLVALGLGALLVVTMIGTVTGAGPTVRFVAVAAMSVAALGADDGVDVFEVLFGLSLVLYIGAWYGATLLSGRRVLRSGADVAMLFFLLASGVGGVLFAIFLGNIAGDLRSDITCLLALAMFFPAREIVVRAEKGPEILAACLLGIGVLGSAMSAYRLQTAFAEATVAYEIMDARITSGEVQAMIALVVALLWAAAAPKWRNRIVLLGIAAVVLGGLVIARSRTQWLAGAAALVVAGAVLPWRLQRRLVPTIVLGAAAGAIGGVALLGERLALFGLGLLKRFASISSSFTQDPSLINRYVESAAAWESVLESPAIGHGWGATITRFDLISGTTTTWSFLHNGYAWIAHKTGALGLLAFVFAMVGIGLQAAWAARFEHRPPVHTALAAAGAGLVVAILLLAYPANPWAILDQMFVIALALALASGVAAREPTPRPAKHPASGAPEAAVDAPEALSGPRT